MAKRKKKMKKAKARNQAGKPRVLTDTRFSAFHEKNASAQSCRAIIIFLISAMALAGFNPFGHVFEQFRIVWQR
jgi:hypothetical protein